MPLNTLQTAKKSRKKPQPGDVFVFQMRPDGLYRYGRVIQVDVNLVAADGSDSGLRAMVVYIYETSSNTKVPVPALCKQELLLPPLFTNETGWRDGYFETVEHRPLEPDDVFPVHCFRDGSHRRYVGLDREPVTQSYEPCGLYAVGGYGAVDWDISKVLGFPAPTEEPPVSVAAAKSSEGSKNKRKRRDVEHEVEIHLADAPGGPLSLKFDQFEEQLIDAVSQAGVGEWSGHEFGLEGSDARIYLTGKDADRLADVVLPIARQADFPKGSFVVKRYGEPGDPEERVQL